MVSLERKRSSANIFFFFSLCSLLMVMMFWLCLHVDDTLLDEQLLYLLMGKTFLSDVYVQYPDGGIKKISPTEGGIYYQANISPDGSKVVFFGSDLGPPRIWCYDLKQDTVVALTPEGVSGRHPVFSADGQWIEFSSDLHIAQERERIEFMHGHGRPPKDMILNIFTMDTYGQQRRQITFGQFQDQRPAFSPDGDLVAFVSNRSGQEQIWIVAADGSTEPQPLQLSGYGYRPWFSADGKTVYFFSVINKRHQICALDVDSRGIYPLANDDSGNSHGPFFDDHRNVLLMHSNRLGKWALFELPLDGGLPCSIQPTQFEESLHVTRSSTGVIAFDVPQISSVRKIASLALQWTRSVEQTLTASVAN